MKQEITLTLIAERDDENEEKLKRDVKDFQLATNGDRVRMNNTRISFELREPVAADEASIVAKLWEYARRRYDAVVLIPHTQPFGGLRVDEINELDAKTIGYGIFYGEIRKAMGVKIKPVDGPEM